MMCSPFFLSGYKVVFSMLLAVPWLCEGRGNYVETEGHMRCGGSWGTEESRCMSPVILAMADALGVTVCSWEVTAASQNIFWCRKLCSDNGCTGFLLQLKLLQSCAAETEGEEENLNSSSADSWHCWEIGCKWHKINRLHPAKFLLNWCHSDIVAAETASPRFLTV